MGFGSAASAHTSTAAGREDLTSGSATEFPPDVKIQLKVTKEMFKKDCVGLCSQE